MPLVTLCCPVSRGGCPSSTGGPLKTLSVTWLPNKCEHRARAQLQSSSESLSLARGRSISFLTSQPAARGQSQGSASRVWISLNSQRHLLFSQQIFIKPHLSTRVWAPGQFTQSQFAETSVAWFSFCHHNSILRNVRSAWSPCSHAAADPGPIPKGMGGGMPRSRKRR